MNSDLRLRFVVDNAADLGVGCKSTATFDTAGGTIGSGADCDWRVDGYKSVIDPLHLTIAYHNSSFVVVPETKASVKVNGSERPIKQRDAFILQDGDRLMLGEFTLMALLEDADRADTVGRLASLDTLVSPLARNPERNQALESILSADKKEIQARFLPDSSGDDPDQKIDPLDLLTQTDRQDKPIPSDPLAFFGERAAAQFPQQQSSPSDLSATSETSTRETRRPQAMSSTPKSGTSNSGENQGSNLFFSGPSREAESLLDDLDQRPRDLAATRPIEDPAVEQTPMTMPALSARHAGTGSGTSSGGSVPSDYLDQLASGALEEDGLMSAPSNNLPERDSWTGGLDGGALEGGQAEVDHIVLRPLLTAMGLQMQDASGPQANRVAQDAGLALKAAIEGLRTLHAKKASGRESLAETQLHPVEDNPLYLDGSLDQTMQALFLNRSPVHLNPADAVTESLNHLNQHHEASEIAIEAALSAILRELSPEALAKRFARYKGHAPREGDQGAWNWAMYAHYYKEMRSGRQRGLNRMFAEVYGQVYDREMRARTSGMEG